MIPMLQQGQYGRAQSAGGGSAYIEPFWPTALYSMRLRNSAYAGPCIRVHNRTSGTQTDIGFGSDGWIDATALAAARVSGEYLDVQTWYDQSGNGLHAVNSAGQRPNILSDVGALTYSVAGRPAMGRQGDSTQLIVPSTASFGFGTGAWTVEAWGFRSSASYSGTNAHFPMDMRTAAGAGYAAFFFAVTTGRIQYYNGSVIGNVGSGFPLSGTLFHMAWAYAGGTGGDFRQFINGATQSSGAQTLNATSPRPLKLFNSVSEGADQWNGAITEVAISKGTCQYTADFTPRSYA